MKVKTLIKKLLEFDMNANIAITNIEHPGYLNDDFTEENIIDYKIIDIFEAKDVCFTIEKKLH